MKFHTKCSKNRLKKANRKREKVKKREKDKEKEQERDSKGCLLLPKASRRDGTIREKAMPPTWKLPKQGESSLKHCFFLEYLVG